MSEAPNPWMMCVLNSLGCVHEVYLAWVNLVHKCNPPRPATDLL